MSREPLYTMDQIRAIVATIMAAKHGGKLRAISDAGISINTYYKWVRKLFDKDLARAEAMAAPSQPTVPLRFYEECIESLASLCVLAGAEPKTLREATRDDMCEYVAKWIEGHRRAALRSARVEAAIQKNRVMPPDFFKLAVVREFEREQPQQPEGQE